MQGLGEGDGGEEGIRSCWAAELAAHFYAPSSLKCTVAMNQSQRDTFYGYIARGSTGLSRSSLLDQAEINRVSVRHAITRLDGRHDHKHEGHDEGRHEQQHGDASNDWNHGDNEQRNHDYQ